MARRSACSRVRAVKRPLLIALAVLACGRQHLATSDGQLELAPPALDFGAVIVGKTGTQPLTLRNTSQGTRSATLHAAAPFVIDVTIAVPGGSMLDVPIVFAPTGEGGAAGMLSVETDEDTVTIPLSGTGIPAPICSPVDDCHGCDGAQLPDGSACNGGSACLTGGRCEAGRCMGTPVDCDDHDACTLDVCEAASGCQHLENICADAADPCHAAACDPQLGCTSLPVTDGTLCGAADCSTAHVCLSGQCQVIAVPEGFTCAPASPCQGKGVCHSGSCERPAATVLQPAWTYEPMGDLQTLYFDGVTDAVGNLYWVECGYAQVQSNITEYTCDAVSFTAQGLQRFRTTVFPAIPTVPVRQLIAGGRYIVLTSDGASVAVSTSSGAQLWTGSLPRQTTHPLTFPLQLAAADDTHLWLVMRDLFVIDAASGSVLHTIPLNNDPRPGLVLDGSGNAYVQVIDSGGAHLLSFAPDGTQRFSVEEGWGAPLSLYNGNIVTEQGAVVSSLNGALVTAALSGWWLAPASTPLVRPGAVTLIGTTSACTWCEACDCAELDYGGVSVRAYVPPSTTPRFDASFGSVYDYTNPVVLGDDSVLVAGIEPSATAPTLRNIDAQGAERFACELPSATSPGDSIHYGHAVALTQGSWATVMQYDCASCLHNPGPVIQAFATPGLNEAPSGWTSQLGGPSRNARAR
jgi:hypothetical protein